MLGPATRDLADHRRRLQPGRDEGHSPGDQTGHRRPGSGPHHPDGDPGGGAEDPEGDVDHKAGVRARR